jgi:hypothetical protein
VPRDDIAWSFLKEIIARVIARSAATKQSQTGIAGLDEIFMRCALAMTDINFL